MVGAGPFPNRAPTNDVGGGGPEFAAAVGAHGAELLRRALWLTRKRDEAWDLYQDTIERGLRKHTSNVPAANIRKWLLIIMHHLFLDRCRASAVRAHRPITPAIAEGLAAPETDPEPWWTSIERAAVDEAVGRLPASARTAFAMHAEGLCYSTISKHLGIPVNTVGTRLRRARLRLRTLLGG